MQTLACYLYPVLLECQVITTETVTTRYPIVYANRIKLYKAADNKLKLLFKNNDQKSVDFSGYTVQFSIFKNTASPAVTTAVTLPTSQTATTNAVLTINSILDELDPGFYNYAIDATDGNGNDVVVYSDDNYGVVGQLEIVLRHQNTTTAVQLVPNLGTTNYAAGNSSLHTFQIAYAGFTGTVNFQGSLDLQPSQFTSWFTFDTQTLIAASGQQLYTYTGSYPWVRLVITTTAGTISNILYLS